MAQRHKPSVQSYRPSARNPQSSIMMANFQFVLIICGAIIFVVINALFALSLIPPVIPPWLTKLAASIGGSFAVIAGLLRFPSVRKWISRLFEKIDGRIVAIIFALILTTALIFLGVTWLFLLLSPVSVSEQNWSKWNPQGQWQTESVPGLWSTLVLASDGSASCCDPENIDLFSPDSTPYDNYAVVARIRVLGKNNSATPGQIYFGVIIQAKGDDEVNLLGMIDSSPQAQPTAFFSSIGSGQDPKFFKNYTILDSDWHVYRIEVTGNNLKFLIDGHLIYQLKSTTYLRNARFGLMDSGYDLEISDVSVSSLS